MSLSIPNLLEVLRKETGMTKADFARMTGVSDNMLRRLYSGGRGMGARTAVKLIAAFPHQADAILAAMLYGKDRMIVCPVCRGRKVIDVSEISGDFSNVVDTIDCERCKATGVVKEGDDDED